VHRCKLVDDPVQRETLEKYLELLKSSPSKNDRDDNEDNFDRDDSLNSSHISIDNIEIDIDCVSKDLAEMRPANSVSNFQYTIKVIDYKRIKSGYSNNKSDCDFENSSLGDNSKSQQRHSNSFCMIKSVEILHKDKVCTNETNESSSGRAQNLSNNYLDNTGSTSIISCYVSDMKPQATDFNAKEKQNENELKDLNQNESLYAISESTRIQMGEKDGTYDDIDQLDNITQTNENENQTQVDKDATLNQEMANKIQINGEANILTDLKKSGIRKSNG
jgi:hypothetical protein